MQDFADQLMIGLLFHMGVELCMVITTFLLCGRDKGLVKLIYKRSVMPEVRLVLRFCVPCVCVSAHN